MQNEKKCRFIPLTNNVPEFTVMPHLTDTISFNLLYWKGENEKEEEKMAAAKETIGEEEEDEEETTVKDVT